MGKHDPLIDEKLSSKGWNALRPAFYEIHNALLSAAPSATAKAQTIYATYCISDAVMSNVFAVTWFKTQKSLTVGLALPESVTHPLLGPQPPKMWFPPLNRYFSITPGQSVPPELAEWSRMAFEHVSRIAANETEDDKFKHI